MLTETSYTKGVRFYKKKKRRYKNEKSNLLFITINTHKGIFGIKKTTRLSTRMLQKDINRSKLRVCFKKKKKTLQK